MAKQFRKKVLSREDDEDETAQNRKEKERGVKRQPTSPHEANDDDDGSESEQERLRDQREREQLDRNIRERDAAATRKLSEQKQAFATRRSNIIVGDVETLRKVSRQEYLKKREANKLKELGESIEDGEYLYKGVKLTEAEYNRLSYEKKIYELATNHEAATHHDQDHDQYYRIPEPYDDHEGGVNQEKRFSVALQRCWDDDLNGRDKKSNPFAEQKAWEDQQIGKATLKFVLCGSVNQLRVKNKQQLAGEQIEPNNQQEQQHQDLYWFGNCLHPVWRRRSIPL